MSLRLLERSSTRDLLASGGDGRQQLDPVSGLNKYGCAFEPQPDVVEFGSCTGSSIGVRGFDAAAALHQRLLDAEASTRAALVRDEYERVRGRIAERLTENGSVDLDVVITPSGTDGELIPLALVAAVDDRPVLNVVIGPAEVGGGTMQAAGADAFDEATPNDWSTISGAAVDDALSARTDVRGVGVRTARGQVRDDAEIDEEVRRIVDEACARGTRVLLHIVAHSKTGVHAPTLAAVADLRARHGDLVRVVIDAAQGRLSRKGLGEALAEGDMVIVTGSKFYGGPPFCGAVLVPELMRPGSRHSTSLPAGFGRYFSRHFFPTTWDPLTQLLPDDANVGLLLRWVAALAEIDAYYEADPASRLAVLREFERYVPERCRRSEVIQLDDVSPPLLEDSSRLLESKTTVFSFALRSHGRLLDQDELRDVQRWMFERVPAPVPALDADSVALLRTRIHIGQPVVLGTEPEAGAVLRLALGGPAVVDYATASSPASLGDRLELLRRNVDRTVSKLELLAEHHDALAAHR